MREEGPTRNKNEVF